MNYSEFSQKINDAITFVNKKCDYSLSYENLDLRLFWLSTVLPKEIARKVLLEKTGSKTLEAKTKGFFEKYYGAVL